MTVVMVQTEKQVERGVGWRIEEDGYRTRLVFLQKVPWAEFDRALRRYLFSVQQLGKRQECCPTETRFRCPVVIRRFKHHQSVVAREMKGYYFVSRLGHTSHVEMGTHGYSVEKYIDWSNIQEIVTDRLEHPERTKERDVLIERRWFNVRRRLYNARTWSDLTKQDTAELTTAPVSIAKWLSPSLQQKLMTYFEKGLSFEERYPLKSRIYELKGDIDESGIYRAYLEVKTRYEEAVASYWLLSPTHAIRIPDSLKKRTVL